MPTGYFGIRYEETHWAVLCKGCGQQIIFAIIQATDGKMYWATVAIQCPRKECRAKRRYRPLETFRTSTLQTGQPIPMTTPLFEE